MLNMVDNSSSGPFFVQSSSDENLEFVNRQKSVFGKLDAVARDKEESSTAHNISKRQLLCKERKPSKKLRYDTRQFRGQESIFKRPEAPPPSRFVSNLPDYLRNPKRWTRYTLSDVSQEDMSDQSNTAAAMSFLQELKDKREFERRDEDTEDKHITFNKPLHFEIKHDIEKNKESPSFKSSKVLMPEYVVGEKKVSKKIVRTKSLEPSTKVKEIKLDHLTEDDEDF